MFENPDPKMRNRMLWAVGLAGLVLVVSDLGSLYLFGEHTAGFKPKEKPSVVETVATQASSGTVITQEPAIGQVAPVVDQNMAEKLLTLPLKNERFEGQVSVVGGSIDLLSLKKYRETLDHPEGYWLLKKEGQNASAVQMGWLGNGIDGPGVNSVWQVEADSQNNTASAVTLVWRNQTGQAFQRVLTPRKDSYLIDVVDRVYNGASLPVSFKHFAQVQMADGARLNEKSSFVNYFGPMGYVFKNGEGLLIEDGFDDVKEQRVSELVNGVGGWWGITSQYFMTAILPDPKAETQRNFRHAAQQDDQLPANGAPAKRDYFTATVQVPVVTVAPQTQAEVKYAIYAGPKAYSHLIAADHQLEQAISWGWFEPLVKGMYHLLVWLHEWLGNWGLAILGLTLLLKIVTFPLANKSYHSMARMKKLQPRIQALREQYKSDKSQAAQQEMALKTMQLYRDEKVNPLGGCWPMLIQIPIFFAMYKMLLVSFEFRHASLGLWIHDMSARDPYFVLPILMGLSMVVQMRMQPRSEDPMQQAIFRWMPVMFTVMFLFFPAGLVLYWLINNILSIIQQYIIMRQEHAV